MAEIHDHLPPSLAADIYDPTSFVPNSANGQHILLDQEALRTAAELVPTGARVIEIGAGPGTLTRELLGRGGDVTAYEVDRRCEPMLDDLAAQTGRLSVRWQNFLDAPNEDPDETRPVHIVGNIPFHISEPLINKLGRMSFDSAVLLIGENLVAAMTAPNPDADAWSRLSLVTRAYFNVEPVLSVPRTSFDPPPRVNAGLVRLTRRDADPAWRSDAVTRAYRALTETQGTNATIAKALKSVVVTPDGTAETGSSRRNANRRTERRIAKTALSDLARDYNTGHRSRHEPNNTPPTSLDMFTIIAKTVDERLLSRPLSGLNNAELRKVCGAISTAINRRRKTR